MEHTDGWFHLRERPDVPENTTVLMWHVYQGVMPCNAENWHRNRFFAYWRPVPEIGWTMAADRRPTKKDADGYNCVLVQDADGRTKVTGWHQFETNCNLKRWMHTPEPPADYLELRQQSY